MCHIGHKCYIFTHVPYVTDTPLEFSDLLRAFDKFKFLDGVKKTSAQDLGSNYISYLCIVCNPNQGIFIAFNPFSHILYLLIICIVWWVSLPALLLLTKTLEMGSCSSYHLQNVTSSLARFLNLLLPCKLNMLHDVFLVGRVCRCLINIHYLFQLWKQEQRLSWIRNKGGSGSES